MRRNLLIALFTFAAICVGQVTFAQGGSGVTTPVTVNINLTDAISITLGADPTVDFNYLTAVDYTQEQTVEKPSHFTVVSNRGYNLAVSATQDFTPTGPDLGIVTVSVDDASATANGGTPLNVTLSQTEQPLLTDASPSAEAVYQINYQITDPTPLLGLDAATYTTTVIYSATQL